MAKQITAKEMAEIITKALLSPDSIDDSDQFTVFMRDISQVVCDHFGGTIARDPSFEEGDSIFPDNWMVGINADSSVPEGGGIWNDYDPDMSVEEWMSGVIDPQAPKG